MTKGKRAVSSAAVTALMSPRHNRPASPLASGVYGPYVVKRSTVRAAGPGTLSQLFSGSKPAPGDVMIVALGSGLIWLTPTRQTCFASVEFKIRWPVAGERS